MVSWFCLKAWIHQRVSTHDPETQCQKLSTEASRGQKSRGACPAFPLVAQGVPGQARDGKPGKEVSEGEVVLAGLRTEGASSWPSL